MSNRHVRVHHVDKDKDDPALRAVLSQRPDRPTRGRRRRLPFIGEPVVNRSETIPSQLQAHANETLTIPRHNQDTVSSSAQAALGSPAAYDGLFGFSLTVERESEAQPAPPHLNRDYLLFHS